MGYSVNAQRSLTNEYPYTEVLNCLSNPDTIFVCRIHNTAKTQYDIHELALFVYKQNGNWFASTLEKYDSSRKTHWILYDPIKVWGISFEMFADANNLKFKSSPSGNTPTPHSTLHTPHLFLFHHHFPDFPVVPHPVQVQSLRRHGRAGEPAVARLE